jgi:hypothetical protein
VNPDFGQVESDPSVVNLTATETFFPERRPFFLEGANLFAFNIGDDNSGEGLFYSRRIGRAPQRRAYPGAHFVDVADAARILGAAKLTGRTANGWSLGVFNAVTGGVEARLATADGVLVAPAEPLTNYAAGRLTRDYRRGLSSVGLMFTTTHRDLDDASLSFLRSSAYGWGVNGRHRFGGNNRFEASAQLGGSSIFGDTLALQLAQRSALRYYNRPDATHLEYDPLRTSMHGLTGQAAIGTAGGSRFSGVFGGAFRTPGFEVNDIGFQNNADQRFVFASFNLNGFQPGPLFQRWSVGVNPNAGWDFGGTELWSQVNGWGNAQLRNFWSVNYFLNHSFEAMSVGALRGGPAIVRPGLNRANLSVTSDRRKRLFVNAGGSGAREHGTGAMQRNVSASASARPTSQLELTVGGQYARNLPAWQYVESTAARDANGAPLGHREYIFAAMDQTTTSLTTRLNYTHSPTLSFQFYAQPFISAGRFDSFRRVADPRARDFDARFETFDAAAVTRTGQAYRIATGPGEHVRFGVPDFNVRQLRSNAVVRWEYRPGSTLFIVWGQQRDGRDADGSFELGRDFDRLIGAPGTNVLLLKLSYWLDS